MKFHDSITSPEIIKLLPDATAVKKWDGRLVVGARRQAQAVRLGAGLPGPMAGRQGANGRDPRCQGAGKVGQ